MRNLPFVYVLIVFIASLVLFYRSFLLQRTALTSKAECLPVQYPDCRFLKNSSEACDGRSVFDPCSKFRRFDRTVFIVIDALYFGFVINPESPLTVIREVLSRTHENQSNWKNRSELSGDSPGGSSRWFSYLYRFRADPPTTTLQRIKGLTTGTLPTFIDAGSNFFNYEIVEDSWIHQLHAKGKSIWASGDEVWETLYPTAFAQLRSFASFDVFDLDTIDQALVPMIHQDLKRMLSRSLSMNRSRTSTPVPRDNTKDWDVYIAHFLGVDHAGHRYGRNHPEMDRKLREMDAMLRDVIQLIPKDTLLVVLGDHGMTKSGDHGGDSPDELNAALWLFWKNEEAVLQHPDESSLTSKSSFLSSRFREEDFPEIAQVDLVPTLSLLLGLPIPFSNVGTVMEELFEERLLAAMANKIQVDRFVEAYQAVSEFPGLKTLNNLKQNVLGNYTEYDQFVDVYFEYLRTFKAICVQAWATFDHVGIFVSAICGGISLVGLFAASRLEGVAVSNQLILFLATIVSVMISLLVLPSLLLPVAILLSSFYLAKSSVQWKCQKEAKTPSLLWGLAVVYALGFASNSFVIAEPLVVRLILGFLLAAHCRTAIQRDQSSGLLIAGSVFTVTACRVGEIFRKCREEDETCHEYVLHKSLSSLPTALNTYKQLIFGISATTVAVFTLSLWWLLRKAGNLVGDTPQHLILRYVPLVNGFATIAYWGLQCLPVHLWNRLSESQKNGCALWVYGTSFIGVAVLVCCPLLVRRQERQRSLGMSSIRLIYSEVRESLTRSPYQLPVVCGLGTATWAFFVAILLLMYHPMVLLAGDVHSGPFTLFLICLLVLFGILGDMGNSTAASMSAGLLAQEFFFNTGHQATFPSLQWEAAFVGGLKGEYFSNLIPGFLVLLNTFSTFILTAFFLPLLVLTGPAIKYIWDNVSSGGMVPVSTPQLLDNAKNIREHFLMAAYDFLIFSAVKLLGTIVSCGILRRHLMVWKIFAPRFLFEAVGFLCSIVSLALGYCLFHRIERKLEGFIQMLHKSR